jgi:hypothetical protein
VTCPAEFPVWAMLTFGVLVFAIGFEAGRAFTWAHHIYLQWRGK